VPVYNHEAYLDDHLDSLINQTYQNIEVIIIDDASPDQSKLVIEDWLERLKDRFERFIYIPRFENKGLIYNCNEAISISTGAYINIVGSDDVVLPKSIEKKVQFLEANKEYGMVYSDAYSGVDVDNFSGKHSDENTHLHGDIFNALITEGNFINAPTVLIRKSIVEEVGGYSEKYMFDDYPMWLEASYRYKVGYIKEPLVYYRLSPNSLSRGLDSYKSMKNSQELLLYEMKKKYNVEVDTALKKMNLNASIFFLNNDRSQYKHYRNKINGKKIEVLFLDLIFYLRVKPRRIKVVRKVYRSIPRLKTGS